MTNQALPGIRKASRLGNHTFGMPVVCVMVPPLLPLSLLVPGVFGRDSIQISAMYDREENISVSRLSKIRPEVLAARYEAYGWCVGLSTCGGVDRLNDRPSYVFLLPVGRLLLWESSTDCLRFSWCCQSRWYVDCLSLLVCSECLFRC